MVALKTGPSPAPHRAQPPGDPHEVWSKVVSTEDPVVPDSPACCGGGGRVSPCPGVPGGVRRGADLVGCRGSRRRGGMEEWGGVVRAWSGAETPLGPSGWDAAAPLWQAPHMLLP